MLVQGQSSAAKKKKKLAKTTLVIMHQLDLITHLAC